MILTGHEGNMKVDLSYTELLVLVDALVKKRDANNDLLVPPEKMTELEDKLIYVMNGYGEKPPEK